MLLFESNQEEKNIENALPTCSVGGEISIPKDAMSMDTLKERNSGWDSKVLKFQTWQYYIMVKSTGSGIIHTQNQIRTLPLTMLCHLGQSFLPYKLGIKTITLSRVLMGIKQIIHLKHLTKA